MDDSLLIWPGTRESFLEFRDTLGSIWPTLQFEEEMENGSNGITFLDMRVKRDNDNKITYIFYQKPTHSGTYLHFSSHCTLATKINIIITEAARIKQNCKNKDDMWPFLEKLKEDFIRSEYPEELINCNILKGITPSTGTTNKHSYDFVLKVPYVNESVTRITKKIIKQSKINARVVLTSGKTVKSMIKPRTSKLCNSEECILCQNEMPCNTSHYVYQFTCNNCIDNITEEKNKVYIGASRKAMVKRLGQHERSVRRFNDSTTLGQHMIESHQDLKPNTIPRRGKPDFNNLFKHFTPKILKNGKDTMDVYIKEGMAIKYKKPSLNNMSSNGFSSLY